ncbi:MAG TPA: hypothetical protein VNG51_14180 [Ktedonobacteraceae bacterium]|nr:hypothetical protein [Ktedonobacteraceae bacterium]
MTDDTQERDLEAQSCSPHKTTGKAEPEFGERDAQARKGKFHLTQMRSTRQTPWFPVSRTHFRLQVIR